MASTELQELPMDDFFSPGTTEALVDKSKIELSKTIQYGARMTGMQHKSLNAIQFCLQSYALKYFDSLEEFHANFEDRIIRLRIPRGQFRALIAFSGNNDRHIAYHLDQLRKTGVSYHNNETGDAEEAEFTNFFNKTGIKKGYVFVEIMPATRRALASPDKEATIDILRVAEELSGQYAIPLYQFLCVHYNGMTGDTLRLELEELEVRKACAVYSEKKSSGEIKWVYPDKNKFKERVIDKAVEEINESGLEFKVKVDFRTLGCGTRLYYLTIIKTERERYSLIASRFSAEISSIARKLKEYGVRNWSEKLAKITNEKELRYFEFCISEVDKAIRSRQKSVKNKAGYFLKSLENNRESFETHYRDFVSEQERKIKEDKEREEKSRNEQEESKFNQQRVKLPIVKFKNMPSEAQDILYDEFFDKVKVLLSQEQKHVAETDGINKLVEDSGPIRGQWINFLLHSFEITDDDIKASMTNATIDVIYS